MEKASRSTWRRGQRFPTGARDQDTGIHRFELHELLGDKGYEGWVSFPKPKHGDCDFAQSPLNVYSGEILSTILRERNDDDWTEVNLYWSYDRYSYGPYSTKVRPRALFGVYRDGILLRGIKQPMWLKGSSILRRIDVDVLAVVARGGETHRAVDRREERVVAAASDVFAGMELGAALPHDDAAGPDRLAAVDLDAQHFRLRVAAVFGGAYAFLMSHVNLVVLS